MNFLKQSALFTFFLINVSFVIRYYSVVNAGADIGILSIALSVSITGIFGGFGFYVGQIKIKKMLKIKHLVISAIIVFFISHTLSKSLDLYQTSWVMYALVLFTISFVAAVRGPKLFSKKG